MSARRFTAAAALVSAIALALTACNAADSQTPDSADPNNANGTQVFPVTVEHALGTTTIEQAPERVATVAWANHEVPLALGVVPVGMARANFGGAEETGMLPWVEERLEELEAETPVLFDETDGIDFEAVADTEPDVILAAYSGLSEEDYTLLSEIAPVIAYPEATWSTSWRDVITYNASGLGMAEEGEQLVSDLEAEIEDTMAGHPDLVGTTTMFITHVDTTDLSTVNFYTSNDTRAAFFDDLGLSTPAAVAEASEAGDFAGSISAEQVDAFDDVELIVTYGDQQLVDTLKADPLLSQMPAVANESVVFLDGTGPLGTASNPTPLAIPWVLEDYVTLLDDAVN